MQFEQRVCAVCGISFCPTKSNKLAVCSHACHLLRNQQSKPQIELVCTRCGKHFFVYPYRESAKFCSKSCAMKRRGPEHNHWKGGRSTMVSGYIRVWTEDGYEYEHRHLMAQELGRELSYDETVHHKSGERADNVKTNLEIMTRADHNREDTLRRWKENPESFGITRERCNKPCMKRGKPTGKLCQRGIPCSFHPE